jgi:hypothetical protein
MKKITMLLLMSIFIFNAQSQQLINHQSSIYDDYQNFSFASPGLPESMLLKTKQSQAIIWSSSMSNANQWNVANDASATLTTSWQWKADTSLVSPDWTTFVGPYMGSATPMNGIFYFDGITNLINANYGEENSYITNAAPINTVGHPNIKIKFYQLYKAFNADSTFLEISSNNSTWKRIEINSEVTVNQYSYGWKEYIISQWAGNKSTVYIRFRFYGTASIFGAQYGGGYGWMIDDVSLEDLPDNYLSIDKVWLKDAYSQIPLGQPIPYSLWTKVSNIGINTQTNVKMEAKESTTNTSYTTSNTLSLNSGYSDTLKATSFFTPSSVGNYFITSAIHSDSINMTNFPDTFKITVNDNNLLSRDNNNYTGSRWNGVSSGTVNPFVIANLYQVKKPAIAYAANFVVGLKTTPNSMVKAVLYEMISGNNYFTISESDYHMILPNEIPTSTGINPPSITLPFLYPVTLDTSKVYLVGVETYGGADTVTIALDNTSIPQNCLTSLFYDNSMNQWYIWSYADVPAMMVRLNLFTPSSSTYLSALPAQQTIASSNNASTSYTVFTSASSWNATTNASWLTISTSGNTMDVIALSGNTTTAPRTATITITASGFTPKTVTITQLANPPYINIYPSAVNISENNGSSASLTVFSNIAWNASTTASWLNVSGNVTSGFITATANSANNTTAFRTAIITVTGAGVANQSVTVTQLCSSPYLIVTPTSQNISYYIGSNVNFMIYTNATTWNATSNSSWLQLTPNYYPDFLSVNALESNLTANQRTATIQIEGIGVTPQQITVIQEASPFIFNLSPSLLTIADSSGSTGIFNITTSISNWIASCSESWLNLNTNSNGTITVTANSSNSNSSPRIAIIEIHYNGNIVQTATVVQSCVTPFIYVYPQNQNVPSVSGASTVFNLGSNVQYSVSTNALWLNIIGNKSQGNITAIAKSANTGTSPRTAEIYVKGGATLQVVTVTQGITVGINDYIKSDFQLYPNPTNGKLNIELNEAFKAKLISIFSLTGMEVMKDETQYGKSIHIDVSTLSKGMYFIKIQSDKNSIIKKFIKE